MATRTYKANIPCPTSERRGRGFLDFYVSHGILVSKTYKYCGKLFRYNYQHCVVEWVYKNPETQQLEVIDSVGLQFKNWRNVEARREYLDEWICELQYEIDDCIKQCRLEGYI